jgi:hypothetical protein
MSQPVPGSWYSVQQGDSLAAIAREAYGDESLWQEIYTANTQVIGSNPNLISPGMVLYLLANPQRSQVYLKTQLCTVTTATLNVRVRPCTKSAIVATYSQGTVLNFIQVMEGEIVSNNPYWGYSTQGHYFWMGGTNWQQA